MPRGVMTGVGTLFPGARKGNNEMNDEYEGRYVVYGEGEDEFGGAMFVPVCEKCGRFVKADDEVTLNGEGQPVGDNATCSKHGRIPMLFVGYM